MGRRINDLRSYYDLMGWTAPVSGIDVP